jgi:hypothetical protein
MKYNKMGKRIIKLTENDLNRIVKKVINEAYEGGIVQSGDKPCTIWCKEKLAKVGSNGYVVKLIQTVLADNGFNQKYQGGGMKDGCDRDWQRCDGKFRNHTKNAVMEFQRKYGLTVDGVVGYDTLSKMCSVLKSYNGMNLLCIDCNCKRSGDQLGTLPDRDRKRRDQIDFDDIDVYNPINKVKCNTLKSCVYNYLYKTAPDIKGFMRCTGLTDSDLPRKPKKGCTSDDGRDLCSIIPKDIPPGMATTANIGYYYDPVEEKCVSRPMGGGPFSQMKKCRECCERK